MDSLPESPAQLAGRVCGRCGARIPAEVVLLQPSERWTGFRDLCLPCRVECLHGAAINRFDDPDVSADPPYRCTRCLRLSEWLSLARPHEYGNGGVCASCFHALRDAQRVEGLPADDPRAWRGLQDHTPSKTRRMATTPARGLVPQQLDRIRADLAAFMRYYLSVTAPAKGRTCARCDASAERLTVEHPSICGRCLFHLWEPQHDTLIRDIFPERGRILVKGGSDARTRAMLARVVGSALENSGAPRSEEAGAPAAIADASPESIASGNGRPPIFRDRPSLLRALKMAARELRAEKRTVSRRRVADLFRAWARRPDVCDVVPEAAELGRCDAARISQWCGRWGIDFDREIAGAPD